jgi:hypothetical protein
MNEAANQTPTLMGLISAAVAPVVLISAVAIFFSALTSKHSHLADQIRQLTAEFRKTDAGKSRRLSIGLQLGIFERRMNALWISTALLSLSLLCFVSTILLVMASQRQSHMGVFGICFMVLGLIFLFTGVIAEMVEIGLAHASMKCEVSDVEAEYLKEKSPG